ncbi:MAG: nuclear transport factor 2 family protein [bacterium]|nr:nuclear transport factor 2 family protein [bacterium]
MTYKYPTILALLLASTFVVQAQSKDETAIRTAIDAMTTAQSVYDAAALERLFTSDYIEISPVGEFDPRAKVLTFYTPAEKEKSADVSIDVAEDFRSIRVYGDTAVAIVELTFTMSKDGKTAPPRKMMATAVCRKERGDWKIASVQYTGIRPPAAQPSAAPK